MDGGDAVVDYNYKFGSVGIWDSFEILSLQVRREVQQDLLKGEVIHGGIRPIASVKFPFHESVGRRLA